MKRKQLGARQVQRREAEFVDDHEVTPEERVNQFADRVVGQSAIQRLDQVGGAEVADAKPGLHRGVTEADEQVRFFPCQRGQPG